jgi:endonuclease/exonuclease/phosphatase family metal-dependent hydrolase
MTSTEKPPEFWRCGRCNTPNPLASYLNQCVACGAPKGEGMMVRSATPKPVAPRSGRASFSWLKAVSLAYLGWLVAVLVVMRTLGGLWAPATVLLFLPRFAWLAPLPLLAWWTWRRKAHWLWLAQAFSTLLILGPIMGLHVPVAPLFRPPPPPDRLRVLTLNQGVGVLDLDLLKNILQREKIDVVCFQEGSREGGGADPDLVKSLTAQGWSFGQADMIASRLPILGESAYHEDSFPEYGFWNVRIYQVEVRTRAGRNVHVANVHMPTVRKGFQKLFQGDLGAIGRLNRWRQTQVEELTARTLGASEDPVVVAGDFNTPRESRLLDLLHGSGRFGFEEVGLGYGYTRPSLLPFVAIDHVVASPEWIFTRCEVGPNVGSDHLPVIAELALPSRPH